MTETPKGYIDEIQPAMADLVAWLTSQGFKTKDSGDGKTNPAAGMEGSLSFPHVIMVVDNDQLFSEALRLRILCEAAGADFSQGDEDSPDIEASFKPFPGEVGVLMLQNVTSATLAEWRQRALGS